MSALWRRITFVALLLLFVGLHLAVLVLAAGWIVLLAIRWAVDHLWRARIPPRAP